MSRYDPPADPFGDERRCRICDGELTYNPLIKGYECTNSHETYNVSEGDAMPVGMDLDGEFGTCQVCGENEAQFSMQENTLSRDRRGEYKNMCHECAWEAFETGLWEADGNNPAHPPCKHCSSTHVNGVFIHEPGCPEEWRDVNRKCSECGFDFKPSERDQATCADCLNDEGGDYGYADQKEFD